MGVGVADGPSRWRGRASDPFDFRSGGDCSGAPTVIGQAGEVQTEPGLHPLPIRSGDTDRQAAMVPANRSNASVAVLIS